MDLTKHNEWLSLWSWQAGRAIEERYGSYSVDNVQKAERTGHDQYEVDQWHENVSDAQWNATRDVQGVHHGIYFTFKVRLLKRVTLAIHGNLPINGVETFF